MSNQVSHFGKLILRKSFTTDGPPTLLTDVGGVTKSGTYDAERSKGLVLPSHGSDSLTIDIRRGA
jgi:hypothetical protein